MISISDTPCDDVLSECNDDDSLLDPDYDPDSVRARSDGIYINAQQRNDDSDEVVPDSDSDAQPGNESERHSHSSPPRKVKKRDQSESARRVRASLKHQLKIIRCGCKNNCSCVISDYQRAEIHRQYWAMSYNDRRQFIFSHTERHTKASTTVGHAKLCKKEFAYSSSTSTFSRHLQTVHANANVVNQPNTSTSMPKSEKSANTSQPKLVFGSLKFTEARTEKANALLTKFIVKNMFAAVAR